jgi:hypothetical protein
MAPLAPVSVSTPVAAPHLASTVVGSSAVTLAPNRDVVLKFAVAIGGVPVGGARASFSIVGASGGATLGSDALITDNDGTVSLRLRAGAKDAKFCVKMCSPGADPVFVMVDVSGKYTGNVVVRAAYTGDKAVDHLDVRLHDGRASCAGFNANPAALPATVAGLTVRSPANDARFNGLSNGASIMASVEAIGPDGRIVAIGCGATTVVSQRDAIAPVQLSDPWAPPPHRSWWGSIEHFFGGIF